MALDNFAMGGSVSQVFRSGSALLSNRDGKVSEHTIEKIHTVFEILRANPKISMQTLEGLLTQIAKVRDICFAQTSFQSLFVQSPHILKHIVQFPFMFCSS